MPDKKLTDNEIVKALESCTQGRDIKICWDCPLYVDLETARECCEKLNTNALDLINRLQAENERLYQLSGDLLSSGSKLFKRNNEIKAEACKEFAELLKRDSHYVTEGKEEIKWLIGQTLKELVGGENGEEG